MTDEIVERVARSARYRDVDRGLVIRLAGEEAARGGSADAVAKRVKRRLHQAVGAFRTGRLAATDRVLAPIRAAWRGDRADPAFRDACRTALAGHASTRERIADLDRFYDGIWSATGGPRASIADLGCGLGPLSVPWMQIGPDVTYRAIDADERPLTTVNAFLDLIGQAHETRSIDLAASAPPPADVALLLKLVPTLDRQDAAAAARLLAALEADHAVVSFARRSLGGRGKGMERTYRSRLDALVAEAGDRVRSVTEASVPSELVFVLQLNRG